jgi:hypothetical protein
MDYIAGLDISMDETHVCVLDREGEVVRESKTVSTGATAVAFQNPRAHTRTASWLGFWFPEMNNGR